MPISPIDPTTGNLPPGIHQASWRELEAAFGWNPHRVRLLAGLLEALRALRLAGCQRVYVNGSFVTAKDVPGDFDGCWDPHGVDPTLLEPTLLGFSNRRAAQKAKYGGELFIATTIASTAGVTFLEFFQQDKVTGDRKGIVSIDLGGLP